MVSAVQSWVPPAAPGVSLLGYCPIPLFFAGCPCPELWYLREKFSALWDHVCHSCVHVSDSGKWVERSLSLPHFRTFWACASRWLILVTFLSTLLGMCVHTDVMLEPVGFLVAFQGVMAGTGGKELAYCPSAHFGEGSDVSLGCWALLGDAFSVEKRSCYQ